jgi:hypothetical protein
MSVELDEGVKPKDEKEPEDFMFFLKSSPFELLTRLLLVTVQVTHLLPPHLWHDLTEGFWARGQIATGTDLIKTYAFNDVWIPQS